MKRILANFSEAHMMKINTLKRPSDSNISTLSEQYKESLYRKMQAVGIDKMLSIEKEQAKLLETLLAWMR